MLPTTFFFGNQFPLQWTKAYSSIKRCCKKPLMRRVPGWFFPEWDSDTSTPLKTNMEPSEIIQQQYFIHDLDLLFAPRQHGAAPIDWKPARVKRVRALASVVLPKTCATSFSPLDLPSHNDIIQNLSSVE